MKHAVRIMVAAAALWLGACSGASPEATIAQSEKLIAEGKAPEARVRLKALLGKHPEAWRAHVLLASIAMDAGDQRAASAELAQLSPDQLQQPAAQALRWWLDLAQGKHAEVLAALAESKVALDPLERARLEATAMRSAGRPGDALEVLRAAAVAAPDNGAIVVELADTLASLGNLQQAVLELNNFLERVPGDCDALAARGGVQLRSGATARAIEDLGAALQSAPPSWSALRRINARMLLGEAGLATGDVALAKAQLAAINTSNPGALGGRLLAASIALFEGRAGDAADTLQVVAQALPENPRVQYMLAEAWVRGGNHARAIDLLERRVREQPGDVTARRMLARLVRTTRPDRVVELLGDLPQDQVEAGSNTDTLLSTARVAQAQASEALEQVQKKLAQNPGDRDLQYELAAAYLRNGQPTRALTTLEPLDSTLTSPVAAALEMRANIASGNDREANKLTGVLIQSQATSVETLLAAADAAQAAARADAARRLIEEAQRREPANAGVLLRRANLEFLDGEYPAAKISLQKLIEITPNDARARAALARVEEARGDLEGATRELTAAVGLAPGRLEPALMLAALHLRNNQAEQALRVLDQMVAAAPQDGVAADAAGQALLRSGRAAEARARFGVAVAQMPTQPNYWYNLGSSQALASDRAASIQSFERAVSLRPEWPEANTAAIQLNLEAKRYAQAAEIASAFSKRLPDDPQAWLMTGLVAIAEARYQDAVAAFSRSYALRPSAAAAVREYQARLATKSLRPAQPLLNWLTQEPTDTDVRRVLAQYYQRVGATQDLMAQLEKLLDIAPNDAVSLNNLAWSIMETDPKRAESLARRAFAIAPQQPAFADTLGCALIENEKFADAARVLSSAVNGLPKDPSIRTRYALALARSGDANAARREVQLALRDAGAFEERATAEKLLKELGS